MQLLAVAAFEPLLAGAQRNEPVGAHLDVVVARLERFVVERVVALGGVARRPDQGLMRIGEAAAAEIRHRVGFAPDDVVENPEAEILQQRADAENVVIGADHPQRRGRLHHAAAGDQPGAREIVVGGETGKLVPIVVDRVDARIVGTLEVALELQIVRRVGEHEIDGLRRELRQLGNAIADQNARRGRRPDFGFDFDSWESKLTRGVLTDAPRRDTTMTQNSDSGDAIGDAGPTTDRADDAAAR